MAGLTPQESAVMTLWDEGGSVREISRVLRLDFDRVRRIVACYGTADEARVHRTAMMTASARLASAIASARAA